MVVHKGLRILSIMVVNSISNHLTISDQFISNGCSSTMAIHLMISNKNTSGE